MDNRCIGCRWHTPRKYGGEGILCHSSPLTNSDNTTPIHCPDWVVKWNLRYGGLKRGFTDEQLLEANRL